MASASVLPLELGAEYYDASTLAALSQTTKECAASKMLAAQWGGVFERRFPCLAWIPAFRLAKLGTLADPRGAVRSLLAASPPLLALNYPLPPAPRDADGRALPLREEVIITAQLSRRGATALSHRPLLEGAIRIRDEEDLTYDGIGIRGGPVYEPDWKLGIPLERTARTEDEHRDLMRQILQLPAEIALDLDAGTTEPEDLAALVETTCRLVDARLRQEVFVVAGDQVWRLDAPRACYDCLDASLEMLDLNFFGQFDNVRGGSFGPGTPTVPLHFHFNRINCAMSTILNVGCYDYLGYLGAAEYEEGRSPSDPLVYTTERIKYPATTLELFAGWENCLASGIVAATGTDDDDDGLSYLRQLLASTRPVRIARAVRA